VRKQNTPVTDSAVRRVEAHISYRFATEQVWGTIEMENRKGFTLIELVVVVMILGILAAVAAPKLLDTSGTATDNGVRQSLAVIRDAVERFAAENGGALPGADGVEATFKTDLAEYLRGPFPKCPVGADKDDEVDMVNTLAALTVAAGTAKSWRYSYQTGEIIINSAATDNSDVPVAYSTY
jgi:prepilin-type N-terminal cleavage/methylation domain-containing protein